jgi:hypothetical protein
MTADKIGAILATGPWRSELRAAAVPVLAGAAVMTASVANFLNHNHYPLLRAEVGILLAILLALVVAMGLLYAVSGRIVRTVLQILLLCVALDLNFDGYIVPVAAVALAVLLQGRAMPFLAVAASVVLMTVLAGMAVAERNQQGTSARTSIAQRADLPVLLHLILDEHIGVEGLPGDMPEASAMKESLKRLYVGNGFHLFGGAYSEHMRTVNAIPRVINFGVDRPWDYANRTRSTLTSNAYFDRLGADGYRIHVSQTDYMNYCANEFVVACETRPAAEQTSIANAPLSTGEKAYLLTTEFAKLSTALTMPAAFYHRTFYGSQTVALPPLGPLSALDELSAELRSAKRGDAYFVHVLLPHSPYALDANCELRNLADWRDQWNGPKRERVAAYLEQVGCLNRKLEAVIEAVGKDAIVIVQGDHGYRIADVEPGVDALGKFSDRDLVASHSAIFAVRAPGVKASYDHRALPTAEILRQFATSGFRSAQVSVAPDFVPSVFLEDRNWKPTKAHPLPKDWPAVAH